MNNELKVTLGLVPDNCTEELAVEISQFSITYNQTPDCNSEKDEYQVLKVTAVNNGMGEDGWYYDLSTEGTHWSLCEPDDIAKIIKDFKSRMEYNITKQKDLKVYENKSNVDA